MKTVAQVKVVSVGTKWGIALCFVILAVPISSADIVRTSARLAASAVVPGAPGSAGGTEEPPWKVVASAVGPEIEGVPLQATAETEFFFQEDNGSISGTWHGSLFKSHAIDLSGVNVDASAVYHLSIDSPTPFTFRINVVVDGLKKPSVGFSLIPLFQGEGVFFYDSSVDPLNFSFSTMLQPGEYRLTGSYGSSLYNSESGTLDHLISFSATVPEPSAALIAVASIGSLLCCRRPFRRAG